MAEQERRIAVETEDGQTVWLPESKAAGWKWGQELLKKGDPEALRWKKQLASELLEKFNKL